MGDTGLEPVTSSVSCGSSGGTVRACTSKRPINRSDLALNRRRVKELREHESCQGQLSIYGAQPNDTAFSRPRMRLFDYDCLRGDRR